MLRPDFNSIDLILNFILKTTASDFDHIKFNIRDYHTFNNCVTDFDYFTVRKMSFINILVLICIVFPEAF